MIEITLFIVAVIVLIVNTVIEFMKKSPRGRCLLLKIRHNLFLPHRLYLFAIFIVSIVIVRASICYFDKESWAYTVFLSTGLSVLAGIVVAVYSELKSISSDERGSLLAEVIDFSYIINDLIIDLEYRCDSDKNLAARYLKIVERQGSMAEKYYKIKTIIKPVPSFGDSDADVVEGIVNRISEAYFGKDGAPKDERESIRARTLDSLHSMQKQLDICKSILKEEADLTNKPL